MRAEQAEQDEDEDEDEDGVHAHLLRVKVRYRPSGHVLTGHVRRSRDHLLRVKVGVQPITDDVVVVRVARARRRCLSAETKLSGLDPLRAPAAPLHRHRPPPTYRSSEFGQLGAAGLSLRPCRQRP